MVRITIKNTLDEKEDIYPGCILDPFTVTLGKSDSGKRVTLKKSICQEMRCIRIYL